MWWLDVIRWRRKCTLENTIGGFIFNTLWKGPSVLMRMCRCRISKATQSASAPAGSRVTCFHVSENDKLIIVAPGMSIMLPFWLFGDVDVSTVLICWCQEQTQSIIEQTVVEAWGRILQVMGYMGPLEQEVVPYLSPTPLRWTTQGHCKPHHTQPQIMKTMHGVSAG